MINYLYIASIELLKDKLIYDKEYINLSSDRRKKVDKLISTNNKKLSILAELLLKKALIDLNINSNFNYSYNENGKPYLPDSNIYFNISHSNDYVICCISENEVGCDIEFIKDINLSIANKFFTNREYNYIKNSNNQFEEFYRMWTLKESFIKNLGLGLYLNLKDFEIVVEDKISVNTKIHQNFFFKEIELDKYKCSVCLSNDADLSVVFVDSLS